MLFRFPTIVAALAGLCGCHGGGAAGVDIGADDSRLRIASASTGGGGADALAAALLVATGDAVDNGTHGPPLPDAGFNAELRRHLETHLDVTAFGAGAGPRLDGSARIRALAALADAPPDRNGNGSNLDETLAEDVATMAARAGVATPAAGMFPLLFQWSDNSADLAALPTALTRDAFAQQRTIAAGDGFVRMDHVGDAMLARVRAAAGLLRDSRGSLAGVTAERGQRGLLLLQQAVAVETTLIAGLFHDGRTLVRLPNPIAYRPEDGARWLPTAFAVDFDRALPEAPAGYRTRDQASDLAGTSRVLHAAVELGWFSSTRNPYPALRDVVTGHPFGTVPAPRRGRKIRPGLLHQDGVTWEDQIGPLLSFRCLSCHSGPFAQGDFRVSSYAETLAGGAHRATHPSVVPGDHANSLLWQVLEGVAGVVPQMPLGSKLPPGEISLVADWIDGGALERSGEQPPLDRLGVDLANVLVRNLRALHVDVATGGLHDRFDGDAPSGFAQARSTGDALVALATYVGALPVEDRVSPLGEELLAGVAEFALQHLTAADGRSFAVFEFARGVAEGRADLHGHARLLDGLLLAGRVLGDARLLERGRALGARLLDEFFEPRTALFATELGRRGRRYTPQLLGDLSAALLRYTSEAADRARVVGVYSAFLFTLLPKLVFAEFGRPGGEVIGDGIADTDGNGIPEPAFAGGAHGRVPRFAGDIREGPDPEDESSAAPVLWSSQIQPLLRSKCAECHFDGAMQGGYRLDTPLLLRTPGDSLGALPLVVPGDPERSLLYRKLVDRSPPIGVQMPQARPPLDDRGKALVRDWILQGARGR